MSDERGTGRTTAQMRTAPLGATFIWCNERTEYARRLARFIGRDDLRIVGPSAFDHRAERLHGLRGVVVVDHAAADNFSKEQWQGFEVALDLRIFDNSVEPPHA